MPSELGFFGPESFYQGDQQLSLPPDFSASPPSPYRDIRNPQQRGEYMRQFEEQGYWSDGLYFRNRGEEDALTRFYNDMAGEGRRLIIERPSGGVWSPSGLDSPNRGGNVTGFDHFIFGNVTGLDYGGNVTGFDYGGNVTGFDYGDGNVTGFDYGDGNVTGFDYGDGNVTGFDYGDGNVTGFDYGDGNVTGFDYGGGNVPSATEEYQTRVASDQAVMVGGGGGTAIPAYQMQNSQIDAMARQLAGVPVTSGGRLSTEQQERLSQATTGVLSRIQDTMRNHNVSYDQAVNMVYRDSGSPRVQPQRAQDASESQTGRGGWGGYVPPRTPQFCPVPRD